MPPNGFHTSFGCQHEYRSGVSLRVPIYAFFQAAFLSCLSVVGDSIHKPVFSDLLFPVFVTWGSFLL
jgi:hypothetical protein